jgi:hypothetical protein
MPIGKSNHSDITDFARLELPSLQFNDTKAIRVVFSVTELSSPCIHTMNVHRPVGLSLRFTFLA